MSTTPRFKKQSSALNLSSYTGVSNQTFYGNLVVSCTGRSPCYSQMSRLIVSITASHTNDDNDNNDDDDNKNDPRWTDSDRMIIRGALRTKSEKLRIYFISLLENTNLTNKYQQLYNNLNNSSYKISENNADFILNQFKFIIQNNDEYILQCLANFTCKLSARPLWDELTVNGVDNDDLTDQQAILDKVSSVQLSPFYTEMKSKGVILDDNEILAIYIYTSTLEFADLMQKHLKIGCKWKQTFYYFIRGVLKIYDTIVYKTDVNKLPNNLYHPSFLSSVDTNNKSYKLLSTINCTSSVSIAKDIAPPDGSMFVLKNTAINLSNGNLIAVPVHWISDHPNEDEWVILPCEFTQMNINKNIFQHNAAGIDVIGYKTIDMTMFGVDILTKLSHLQCVQDLNANGTCDVTATIANINDKKDINYYKNKCIQLQNQIDQLTKDMDDIKSNNNKKGVIKIPFKKIKSEAFLIKEKNINASMCVTICNGELSPPFISAKGINWLKNNYVSNQYDIFIDTYAKCGTTVGIKMVYKILEMNGKISAGSNKTKINDPWNAVPWIEVDVSQQLLSGASPNDFLSFIESSNLKKIPRIWKTHAPFVNFPSKVIGDKTKIIHIIRNPKDVICSYYDFFKQEPLVNYKGSFDTLFDWFCDGSVVHSNFFDFELNWFRSLKYGKLNQNQLLIISYEDICRKPIKIIEKVSKFLGYKMNNNQIKDIADAISFKKSKAEALLNSDIPVIVNKGKIGRWKSVLSVTQKNRIDRIINARLKDTGIQFTYE